MNVQDLPSIFAAIAVSKRLNVENQDKNILECMGVHESILAKRIIATIYRTKNAVTRLQIGIFKPLQFKRKRELSNMKK